MVVEGEYRPNPYSAEEISFESLLETYRQAVITTKSLSSAVAACETNNIEYLEEEFEEALSNELDIRSALLERFEER